MWALVGVTLVTLLIAWSIKQPCIDHSWDAGYPFNHYCYSDVQALYDTRGASDGKWPYLDEFNEYPVLTGVMMHVVAEATHGKAAYITLTAVVMGALAIAITLLLAHILPRRKVLYWAAAPAIMLYATYNWDMLAVAFAVAAIWAFRKGATTWVGVLLGLGACAKLFPALLAPALGMAIARVHTWKSWRPWAFGAAFFVTVLVVHLPFIMGDPHLLWQGYKFQLERGANFESIWYVLGHLGRAFDARFLEWLGSDTATGLLSPIPVLAALAFSAWAAWRDRLDPVWAAAIPVFAFLAFNKVFSVQYTLWAVPLFILVGRTVLQRAALVAADVAVFVTLFTYFAVSPTTTEGALFTPVAVAVLARFAVFAWAAADTARCAWMPMRLEPEPPGNRAARLSKPTRDRPTAPQEEPT